MPQNDQALLARLGASGLEFVVIGGVCAVLIALPHLLAIREKTGGA